MIEVIPGINETDKEEIDRKLGLIDGLVKWVQIDIADNTLVTNTTYTDASGLASLIEKYPGISFEAHLMVASPEKYIKPLADAGFKRLIAHAEAVDVRLFLDEAQYESVEVGLALDGASEVVQVEPFLDKVDFSLVMTIEAGLSGQEFLPETVEKIRLIREDFPDLPIEVDGGINPQTIKLAEEAGATRAAVTSYIFKNEDNVKGALNRLVKAA